MNKKIFSFIITLVIFTAPTHAAWTTKEPSTASKIAGYTLKTLAWAHIAAGTVILIQTPLNPFAWWQPGGAPLPFEVREEQSTANGKLVQHYCPTGSSAMAFFLAACLDQWGDSKLNQREYYCCDTHQTPQPDNNESTSQQ